MREYVEETWGWDEEWQRRHFEGRFAIVKPRVILLGPEPGSEPVGMIELERRPAELYVSNIQILPSFQGAGIGTAVLREVLNEARAMGVPAALQVLHANLRAQRLYERLGFRVTGSDDTHVRMRAHDDGSGGAEKEGRNVEC
jgi:ribosomal protein S18 acetylase RimI-like enzyme